MSAATIAPGTTFSGSRLLQDGEALSSAVRDGRWLDGGIAFLDTLGDGAAALSDPIGTLTSIGLGWVMEHLKPLSTWLDQLAGSEANVNAVARQWTSAGSTLRETGATLTSRLRDLEGLRGGTVQSYVRFAQQAATHLGASGDWAQSAASGLGSASALVSRMQGVVKSAISQVVATAIEAMAVVAASFGLGMGYAIARVVMKVNQMVNKVVRPLRQVLTSVKTLTTLVGSLRTLFEGTATKASQELRGTPERISIDAGAVVDASAATAYGRTAEADLRSAGRIADRASHALTPVAPLAPALSTVTADGSTAGTTSLGGGGVGVGGPVGLGGASGLGGAASGLAGSSGPAGVAIAGGSGFAASAAAARSMSGSGAGLGMRGPGVAPGAAASGDTRDSAPTRRRRLRVVIESTES